jgi:hypothetical protein
MLVAKREGSRVVVDARLLPAALDVAVAARRSDRGGIRKVVLPEENRKDLKDVPKRVRHALELVPVQHMDDVLQHALADPAALFRGSGKLLAALEAAPAGGEPAVHGMVMSGGVGEDEE